VGEDTWVRARFGFLRRASREDVDGEGIISGEKHEKSCGEKSGLGKVRVLLEREEGGM